MIHEQVIAPLRPCADSARMPSDETLAAQRRNEELLKQMRCRGPNHKGGTHPQPVLGKAVPAQPVRKTSLGGGASAGIASPRAADAQLVSSAC